MLRRSNPPIPLGPTTAHLAASTFMLYALTFRVFLLSVATSATSMALEAFRKIWHLLTRTPGMVDCAPGISSLLYAVCRMQLLIVTMIFGERGPKSAGHREGGLHSIQNG